MMDHAFSSLWLCRFRHAFSAHTVISLLLLLSLFHPALGNNHNHYDKNSIALLKDGSEKNAKNVISVTKDIKDLDGSILGVIRYHYYDSSSSLEHAVEEMMTSTTTTTTTTAACSNMLFFGVGTFMSVTDYNKIFTQVVVASELPIVAVVLDANVDHVSKTSGARYAQLVNFVRDHASDIIPICVADNDDNKNNSNNNDIKFFIGGHSASGQAALEAYQMGLFDLPNTRSSSSSSSSSSSRTSSSSSSSSITSPTTQQILGFIGLDPYKISPKTINEDIPLDIPSLFWGLTETTCLVDKDKAARAAFNLAESDARVLYTIHNDHGSGITHCVFTDQGCGKVEPLACPKRSDLDWVIDLVIESIHRFFGAIQSSSSPDQQHPHGGFTKAAFELDHETPVAVDLRVNDEDNNDDKKWNLDGNHHLRRWSPPLVAGDVGFF